VRAENILIGKDNKSIWIVDFEFSENFNWSHWPWYTI